MADTKASLETAAGTLDGTEIVRITQSVAGTPSSVRTTTQAIANLAAAASVFSSAAQVWIETAGNDSTAVIGNSNKPFQTINAALTATTGATVLHIGVGIFASPTGDLDYSNTSVPNSSSKLRANLWFKGSKKPQLDSYTTPTELVNGTILVDALGINGINTRSGIMLTDLGIDSGTARGAGDHDGLAIFNIGKVSAQAQLHGLVVDNVISLCHSATSSVHAFCFENCINPAVTRLESYYGTHGATWKCVGGYLNGLISYGHASDVLIIKESNTGDNSAPCHQSVVSNIIGGALTTGDTALGVAFDVAGSNDLYNIVVSNVQITNAMTTADIGLTIETSQTGKLRNIKIADFQSSNALPSLSITGSIDKTTISVNGQLLDSEIPLTSGSTVSTNCALGNNFRLVLGTNATLANPTNMAGGQVYQWRVKQDGSGSRTLAYGSKFKWFSGTAPVLSTGANAMDLISAQYSATDDTLIATFGLLAS